MSYILDDKGCFIGSFFLCYPLIRGIMPIPDCEVRDPRIRRTRQLLQGALRTLMQSKSFDEIAVQDITEAATVNRATFTITTLTNMRCSKPWSPVASMRCSTNA